MCACVFVYFERVSCKTIIATIRQTCLPCHTMAFAMHWHCLIVSISFRSRNPLKCIQPEIYRIFGFKLMNSKQTQILVLDILNSFYFFSFLDTIVICEASKCVSLLPVLLSSYHFQRLRLRKMVLFVFISFISVDLFRCSSVLCWYFLFISIFILFYFLFIPKTQLRSVTNAIFLDFILILYWRWCIEQRM